MSSEDSDFYGDDDVAMDLKSRVRSFDVDGWWRDQKAVDTPMKVQARKQAGGASTTRLHNPFAGVPYAWQLTETVDAFLERLPPATTDATLQNPWIWICNPYIERKAKAEAENQMVRGGEDEMPEEEGARVRDLVEAGEERLHFAADFINMCKQSGQSQAFVTRESRKAGTDAAKDILALAKELRVTCGKWMIFCNSLEVNDVWDVIAKATANNELGIAAKVAPRSTTDRRTEQLICVYTADFTDMKDVKRVAESLKQLGLVRGKSLYYKPDVFTYLGIASGNPWAIKASIYDTRTLLGK
ncbi:hypothetical protein F5X96DRAFT_679574 [Biscogniauxia mediterranea]|nr:hypothetical protein F5X96DRAFT_679574 [Biscogniauxia mediterranea]